MKTDHRTRIFLEEFTTNGVYDYKENDQGIDDFMQSMKAKLKQELHLNFVRPVLLDGGKCKNALFLLTRSVEGMLLMNQICIKKSKDGSGINTQDQHDKKDYLIKKDQILRMDSRYTSFEKKLAKQMESRKRMTNNEVIKFAIAEEFRPKDAKDVLEKLHQQEKVKVVDRLNNEVKSKQKWYIAADPKGNSSTFIWNGN
jgi:predicted O-linked N-acetylglucosamine transferase (SPINDLY family)